MQGSGRTGAGWGKWVVVKMSGLPIWASNSVARDLLKKSPGCYKSVSHLCVLCKYLWWIRGGPKIISWDDEWAWIIAEPLPGIPYGTENNTMPGPGAEKVRRNEDSYSSVWCAVLGATSLIRILCHLHIHLQQVGGRHLGWQQHLAINSLGW